MKLTTLLLTLLAVPALALDLAVSVSGTPTADEIRMAKYIVGLENERLAALDPPGTPLPTATNAELRTSYETILAARVADVHASYIEQAKDVVEQEITKEDKQDVNAALKDALDKGVTIAQITAAIAAL